jgi:hypothetical protein
MNLLEENPRFPGLINITFNKLTVYGYLIHDQNWVSIFDAYEVTEGFRFSSRSFERGRFTNFSGHICSCLACRRNFSSTDNDNDTTNGTENSTEDW